MLKIESDHFLVTINPKGAELTQITDKKKELDYLWQGTAWKRHAPILFPSIGRSNDDHYLIDQKEWPMPQHGFARDYDWTVVEQTATEITLSFVGNHETATLFPFKYTLQVTYALTATGLNCHYEVINNDQQAISFALGSHPGFNVPLVPDTKFDDYYLDFGEAAELATYLIDPAPFRSGQRGRLALEAGQLALNHRLFDKGLILFDRPSTTVTLRNRKTTDSISLKTADFPYMALWTLENQTEDFLCIEPFAGLPDQYGQQQAINTKLGNQTVEVSQRQQFDYQMIF